MNDVSSFLTTSTCANRRLSKTMAHEAARSVICLADGNSLHFLLQEGIADLIRNFRSNLLESIS